MNELSTPLKILFVEDSRNDYELIKRTIEKSNLTFEDQIVDSRDEFILTLTTFIPDIILSDYTLPQFDGLQAFHLKQELCPATPFILITGSVNEEFAVECMKSGIDDYVLKDNLKRLGSSIKSAIQRRKIENEKNLTEKALIHSEERFKLLFEKAPMGYQSLDINGCLIEVNETWCSILGYSKDEVLGHWVGEFMTPESAELVKIRFPLLLKNGSAHNEFEMIRKTGETILVAFDGKIGYTIEGHFKQTHCVLDDITEQRKAYCALVESHDFNQTLLQTIPFGIEIVDETGTIQFANRNLEKLIGESVLGRKCWEIYNDSKEQCINCPLKKEIEIGVTNTIESEHILSGHTFSISHTGLYFQGKKALLEIFQDITERKRFEKDLIDAKEKAEENDLLKTAFMHNISHEIRTPMNAIVGFSELLNESNISDKEKKHFTELIINSSNYLLSFITDIINISTIDANQVKIVKSEVDINSTLKHIYNQFYLQTSKKGIEFVLEQQFVDSELIIFTDETKLVQVITNLVGNAIKFTTKGFVKMGCFLISDQIQFYVTDSGIGIDEHQKEVIFDRFRQADNNISKMFGGSGLGLSISKAYVELMGGKIWIESELGVGSTFNFTIPII